MAYDSAIGASLEELIVTLQRKVEVACPLLTAANKYLYSPEAGIRAHRCGLFDGSTEPLEPLLENKSVPGTSN